MTQQKQYSFSDWTRYKFLKENLRDAQLFRHEIEQKLQDREPLNRDELLANMAMYNQDIIDTENSLRLYDGIEGKFTVKLL